MIRVFAILVGLALVLLIIRSGNQDSANRQSTGRALDAAQGNIDRPIVPVRPATSNQ